MCFYYLTLLNVAVVADSSVDQNSNTTYVVVIPQ